MPVTEESAEPTSRETTERRGRTPLWYALAISVAPYLFLLLMVVVASTPWFLTHDDYPGIYHFGYGLRLNHADCDIVIYGDSTSLTGLDPKIIQDITGLKTCNVSEGIYASLIMGSFFPLDNYLKYNKRPRYLLAQYSPMQFKPNYPPFSQEAPEGILYGLQYDRHFSFYKHFVRHCNWLLRFGIWAEFRLLSYVEVRYTPGSHYDPPNTRAEREQNNGRWTYSKPPQTHCERWAAHLEPSEFHDDPKDIAQFRQRYSVGGTTVIVNTAPTADCDPMKDAMRKASEGLHDNQFQILPISDFNDWDVHPNMQGGRIISIEAGNQILALMHQAEAAKSVPAQPPK